MTVGLRQGDILKIEGYRNKFLVVSNNAYINATGMFHVCPVYENLGEGPLHISVDGAHDTHGTVACEQIKLIDPVARNCSRKDWISYDQIMNISDTIQGIFEYD